MDPVRILTGDDDRMRLSAMAARNLWSFLVSTVEHGIGIEALDIGLFV
jgi:hypothetical protein